MGYIFSEKNIPVVSYNKVLAEHFYLLIFARIRIKSLSGSGSESNYTDPQH